MSNKLNDTLYHAHLSLNQCRVRMRLYTVRPSAKCCLFSIRLQLAVAASPQTLGLGGNIYDVERLSPWVRGVTKLRHVWLSEYNLLQTYCTGSAHMMLRVFTTA
jgi:hypothetical protein